VSPTIAKLRTIAGAPAATGNVLELDALTIHGDLGVKADLNAATTSAVHEASLEGASTLTITVRDPTRALLRSNVVKTKATLTLDQVQYRLVKVARHGGELTLTFEETAVNVLREHDSPRKANRDTMTRAQFVQGLVREPRDFQIPFLCPELKVQQPIAPPAK
jgi:hypothetical protein